MRTGMKCQLICAIAAVLSFVVVMGVSRPALADDRAGRQGKATNEQQRKQLELDIDIDAAIKDVESNPPSPVAKGAGKNLDWDAEAYNRIDLGRDAQLNRGDGGPGVSWSDKSSGEDLKRGYTGNPPKKPFVTLTPNWGN